MNTFIIGDAQLCIGCQACMVACARAHEKLPTTTLNEREIPFHSRVTVVSVPEVTVAIQCRQCEDSPCASSCPVDAIVQKDAHIEVVKEKCIGCKSCILACPFGAIKVVEDPMKRSGIFINTSADSRQIRVEKSHFFVEKCNLCADCGPPACVAICPAKALQLVDPYTIEQKVENRQKQNANRMRQYRSQLTCG